jgi:hypothetical protein
MKISKKRLAICISVLAIALIGTAFACSYFHVLPTNGIGYWTKQKEDSKVIVANVTEHIVCDNGLLHIEFNLINTDGKVKGVELWLYFKDSSGTILEEKYFYVGDMNAQETKHFSADVLFTPQSELDRLTQEDFSIHYTK